MGQTPFINMTKKRNVLVAVMFSIISPGLGFLYVGKPLLAVGFPLVGILTIAFISWTRLIFNPPLVLALVVLALAIWIAVIAVVAVMAHRQGEVSLSKTQRWYVYLAFIVVSSVAGSFLHDYRSQWFGYEPYRFPSSSMADTLLHGEFILSDTWKYRSSSPERGDLIVFRFPGNPSIYYAKRVIGIPGDYVEIKDGVVYVNGEILEEPYINPNNNKITSRGATSYKVSRNGYFVLGDNRDHSNDSRYWGLVPKENVHGSMGYIWFSYDSASGIRTDRIGRFPK